MTRPSDTQVSLKNLDELVRCLNAEYDNPQFTVSLLAKFSRKLCEPNVFTKLKSLICLHKMMQECDSNAQNALTQNYPCQLFEIVIIADSFSEATLITLRNLPLKIIEVKFEKSTKGKALQKAMEATAHDFLLRHFFYMAKRKPRAEIRVPDGTGGMVQLRDHRFENDWHAELQVSTENADSWMRYLSATLGARSLN